MHKYEYKEYINIQDSFKDSSYVEISYNGNSVFYYKGTHEYNCLLFEFEQILYNSYQVPALGVSLDEMVKEERKKDLWVEFNFNDLGYNSEMPFEALLVKIENDAKGFNVIRKYDGKYDGRNFYINLVGSNMSDLYMYLLSSV